MDPVLQWVGGKKRLLSTLKLFTDTGFNNYHEIFLGGGALLLDILPENSVCIEKNVNIYKIYENIKNNHEKIITLLKQYEKDYLEKNFDQRKIMYFEARTEFNELKYDTLENSIKKSTLLLFINKTCFNAVYRENSKGLYNVPFGNGRNCKICDIEKIVNLSNYLNNYNVSIVNQDFEFIKEKVTRNDLVYIDPPYYPLNASSFTTYTHDGFNQNDHDRLIELIKYLHEKNVKVILSNSNNQYFKDKLDFMNIYEISISRTLNCKKENRKKTNCEMIISNVDITRTIEVKNENGLSLNSGDKVDTTIINKKSYFIDENNNVISLIPENLVNILLNNKNKFELSVSDMVEYEKILIDIVAF